MQNFLDLKNQIDYIKLQEPANIIKEGGIVVFPTETVYGIGADALNEEAIKRLYNIKERPFNKKTSLLVSSIDMLNQVTQNISYIEYKLIKKFFPGPLTLILKKRDIVPNILTNNEEIVGFRMPANRIALELIENVGRPIATSSANLTGEPSGTNLEDIRSVFRESVDFYIDGGKSKIGIGSTIVQVINGVPHIIRKGSITKEQIEEVTGRVIVDCE